jgi:hypothetical protein
MGRNSGDAAVLLELESIDAGGTARGDLDTARNVKLDTIIDGQIDLLNKLEEMRVLMVAANALLTDIETNTGV